MEKIITLNLAENFIKEMAAYLDRNYISKGADISRLAFVFGGKRPSLFLKKELSQKIGKSFIPPKFFSIEEFVKYVVTKDKICGEIPFLDNCYTIYRLAQKISPEMLVNKETFRKFLPWAKEISKFLENLDLEMIDTKSLDTIEKVASIGYDVPENINGLFRHIVDMRDEYHGKLNEKKLLSRGMFYLEAGNAVEKAVFDEFDKIFFCNFFYLHKSEEKIIKTLYEKDKAVLFFQGSQDDWKILSENAGSFSCSIKPQPDLNPANNISIYRAFDIHSQVSMAREVLKSIKKDELDSTVIVSPKSECLMPLLCESSSVVTDINVSMGYPLNDNPVYALFQSIFEAQASKNGDEYYSKDYLKVITNPLVKNFRISPVKKLNLIDSSMITRIIVHKIEEILRGCAKTCQVTSSRFVSLESIGGNNDLYDMVLNELGNTVLKIEKETLMPALEQLHELLFFQWEKIGSFNAFAQALKLLLDALYDKSPLDSFPLNRSVVELISRLQQQLQESSFKDEEFEKEDIFKIFEDSLDGEVIAFSGMPLKGLQVLGLLETRALSFDNVIILDVNESVIPKLRLNEPLIPRDIMGQLGLNLIEREEEVQRYYFKRLISSAKNVHLIYREGQENQRSRFIEEIIWGRQKEKKSLSAVSIPAVSFNVEVLPEKKEIKKEKHVIEYLKKRNFSPSSLDTYLGCSLKFYYKYVLCLDENKSRLDEPEAVDVGDFIHHFLEESFKSLRNAEFSISKEFSGQFNSLLNKRFDDYFSKRMGDEAFMLKEVVRHRMANFLEEEKNREPQVKEILELERPFRMEMKFNGDTFGFGGVVDRIDRLRDGTLLVIDYKTGNAKKMAVKSLLSGNLQMSRDSISKVIKSFQLPIYLHYIKSRFKEKKLDAGFYFLRETKLDRLFSKESIEENDFDTIMELSKNAMEHIICNEILNPEVPFMPDAKDKAFCGFCPFFYLCR